MISDFNNVEYKLSKNNGLIKFVPLRLLGDKMVEYEMIGFDDEQEHGFTNSWKNYFGGWLRYDHEMVGYKNGAYILRIYIEETFILIPLFQ
ncbi:MAG: hypothetical protein R2788_08230 [Saprospiraceae bacterium]